MDLSWPTKADPPGIAPTKALAAEVALTEWSCRDLRQLRLWWRRELHQPNDRTGIFANHVSRSGICANYHDRDGNGRVLAILDKTSLTLASKAILRPKAEQMAGHVPVAILQDARYQRAGRV